MSALGQKRTEARHHDFEVGNAIFCDIGNGRGAASNDIVGYIVRKLVEIILGGKVACVSDDSPLPLP
jgi:hypothetical protein